MDRREGRTVRRRLIPSALRERPVRRGIQNLYAGFIGATENANYLLKHEPGPVDSKYLAGPDRAKRCTIAGSMWLQSLQEFGLSPELFQSQILSPVRAAAKYIVDIRKHGASTSLTGWIFSKSDTWFDKDRGTEMVLLSLLVPSLKMITSVRCRVRDVEEVESGSYYRFTGLQPVPFFNRAHVTKLSVSASDRKFTLGDFDFLKTAIHDTWIYYQSFALENYCEIQSSHLERLKRRLGVPVIFAGKILVAESPYILVQSLANPEWKIQLVLTDMFLSHLPGGQDSLSELNGKYARFLGIWWYKHRKGIKKPELLGFEPVSEEQAVLDDLEGYVRIRWKVGRDALQRVYPAADLKSLKPPLSIGGSEVEWVSASNSFDDVTRLYQSSRRRISELRHLVKGFDGIEGPYKLEAIFNVEKMEQEVIAQIVRDGEKGILAQILTEILRNSDQEEWSKAKRLADLATLIAGRKGLDREDVRQKLKWLKERGVIERIIDRELTPHLRITSGGINVIYHALQTKIETLLTNLTAESSGRGFYLPDVAARSKIPGDLLKIGLEELEKKSQVARYKRKDGRADLYWMVPLNGSTTSAQEWVESHLGSLARQIEEIMSSSYRTYEPEIVRRILAVSGRYLELLTVSNVMFDLEKAGRIRRLLNTPKSWIFNWGSTIAGYFADHPEALLTAYELKSAGRFSSLDELQLTNILRNLIVDGKVSLLKGRFWTHPSNLPAKDKYLELRFLLDIIRPRIIQRGGSISYETLVQFLVSKEGKKYVDYGAAVREQERRLLGLIDGGYLVKSGSLCKLGIPLVYPP